MANIQFHQIRKFYLMYILGKFHQRSLRQNFGEIEVQNPVWQQLFATKTKFGEIVLARIYFNYVYYKYESIRAH
jgi:hypothetical protein